jgi:hypothetical protein
MLVLRVRIRAIENSASGKDEGLKMWTRRPSRSHLRNSRAQNPTATIRNCRWNHSGLNHRNRFVLKMIGNGPKPKVYESRRDQLRRESRP